MSLLKSRHLIPGILLVSTLCGCKKVIDVNLKNSTPQIVITGEINNHAGPYRVTISRSVNFTENNNFPAVPGAFVTITSDGLTDTLTEATPGIYLTHSLSGVPGSSYSLFISVEGKTYKGTSVMPDYVRLDSIDFISSTNNSIFPVAYFQDPPGISNYYQFLEYTDGERLTNGTGNFVFDDRLSDGRYISRILYSDSTDFKSGSTLTVQMNGIDQPVSVYLNELLQISGGSGGFSSPTPANPTSNISGGALGYFSAITISSKSVIVP
jgi:hypothetical protein